MKQVLYSIKHAVSFQALDAVWYRRKAMTKIYQIRNEVEDKVERQITNKLWLNQESKYRYEKYLQ